MAESEKTRVDATLDWLKNNKLLSVVVVCCIVIIGIGAVTSALSDIEEFILGTEDTTRPESDPRPNSGSPQNTPQEVVVKLELVGDAIVRTVTVPREDLEVTPVPAPDPANPTGDIRIPKRLMPVDRRNHPYIATMLCQFRNRRTLNTGTLIAPRCVLTSAHAIFDPRYSRTGFADKIEVTLGGDTAITIAASELRVPEQWKTESHYRDRSLSTYDFGCVVLAEPVDDLVRPLVFESLDADDFMSSRFQILGYRSKDFPEFRLYGAATIVDRVVDHRVYYKVATHGGMSGGPLCEFDLGSNRLKIRGIHTSFFDRPGLANDVGSGIRLTESKIQLINHWITETTEGEALQ